MRIIDKLFGRGPEVSPEGVITREALTQRDDTIDLLQERLAELELHMEDDGWQRLGGDSDNDFSREALRKITRRARLFWLHNPLIKRGVFIQTSYVFGLGVNTQGRDKDVNTVIQAFLDDPKNQSELTSLEAMGQQEDALQIDANLFFVFFINRNTGAVRVRSIPFAEVEDTITNPDDAKEVWYYKRTRTKRWFDPARGTYGTKQETIYYPDWRHRPAGGHPRTIAGARVEYETPVYHVAVNKLPDMKFGVSEVYAALDWAKAYKEFLENWATIVKSYARFAWEVKTKGGKGAVAATSNKLQAGTRATETAPAPAAGAAFVAGEGQSISPIRTAGATTSAEDGRRLLLMVCAGLGIYEHYFGDPSTGNLATATSMERPMELKFKGRQRLWQNVLSEILYFVLECSARAPGGVLAGRAAVFRNDWNEEDVDFGKLDTHVDVDFPDLLEKDLKAKVDAIIAAGTLNGQSPAGLDLKTMTRMLLVALGEDEVDQLIGDLFPENWEEVRAEKAAKLMKMGQAAMKGDPEGEDEDDDALTARETIALGKLEAAVVKLAEATRGASDAA
jgi:hypothetical protein